VLERIHETCWTTAALHDWITACEDCALPLSDEGTSCRAKILVTADWLLKSQALLKEASNAYEMKQSLRRIAMQEQLPSVQFLLTELRSLERQLQ
jgi:hypothetical protein